MALPFSFSSELKWSDHLNQTHGPFENGTDLYVVLLDKTANTAEVWKSTDSGDSWAEQDSVNHPAIFTTSGTKTVDVVNDGTSLYVLFSKSGGGLVVQPFDLSTNLWGTQTASFTGQFTNISGQRPWYLGRRSDGDYVVLVNNATESIMGTGYRRVTYSRHESGSWTSNIDVAGTGVQAHYDARAAILGSSDRVHFFWTESSTGNVKHRSLSSANVLDTANNVDNSNGNAAGNYTVGLPVMNGSEIIVPWAASVLTGDLWVSRTTSGANPTWTRESVTSTNDPEVANSNPGAAAVDGSTVHVFWPNDADQDIYRDNDAGTGTWGTDTEWKDAITCQGVNITKITGGIGVLYDDGGTVKYDLFSAGPVTQNATSAPGIQAALAPSARLEAQATATPGVQAALAPAATRIQPATAAPGIQAALAPAGTLLGVASASPGVQAALAPSATLIGLATSAPGIQAALGPSAIAVLQASATPGIELGLAPAVGGEQTATAAPGITVALTATATRIQLTTASPGVTVALAPAGTLLGLATASPGVTVALAPSAIKVTSTTATPGITAALSATGVRIKLGSASPAITVALVPTSTAIRLASASPGVTVALVPVGLATLRAQATPAVTIALAPTADVLSTGSLGGEGYGTLFVVATSGTLAPVAVMSTLGTVDVWGSLGVVLVEGTLVKIENAGNGSVVDASSRLINDGAVATLTRGT